MHAPGRGARLAPAEHDLERLGSGKSRAKLTRHGRRWTAPLSHIDSRSIDEICALQHRRRESQQQTKGLLLLGLTFETKIFFERHATWEEIQKCDAHAERRRDHGWNAKPRASGMGIATCGEREIIEAIDIDIDIAQEVVDILRRHALRERSQLDLGIDVTRHLCKHVELGTLETRDRGADLAIEVGDVESVEVGEVEFADAEPCKRQQMDATYAPEPRDRDAFFTQQSLLALRHPADVARERFIVIEQRDVACAHHSRSPSKMRMILSDDMTRGFAHGSRVASAGGKPKRRRTLLHSFASGLLLDVRLAFRSVLRQKRRSALGLAAVVFGIVALVLATGFIEWTFFAMREETINSRLGHIQIARAGYNESGVADPFKYLLSDQSPELATVSRAPGVTSVAPRLVFSGLVSHGDATLSFIAEGIDAEKEEPLSRSLAMTAGKGLSGDDAQGVIVGQGLADNLGVKVGDRIVLVANRRGGGINAVEVRVRGLFSTISKAYDDAALRVPLVIARKLLGVSGAHTWVVVLDRTEQTPSVLSKLQSDLAKSKLDITPWYDMADFYNKTVVLFSKQVGVLKVIIAAIIVLSISNTLMMGVLERTGEIGTRMALGYTSARILRQFMSEGVVLGVVGGVIGVVLAFALAHVISTIGIPMPPPPGRARGFIGEILVTWPIVFDAIVLAILTTLGASLYPAWRASRLAIVDALRHNR